MIEQSDIEVAYKRTLKEQERAERITQAAPDMLKALSDIFHAQLCPEPKTLKGWQQRDAMIDRIVRNALNKAEGSDL
jgi:hypothetical protein